MKSNSNENNVVTVVFAANDFYAPYLGVAIYSLIRRTSNDHVYKIYILETTISLAHKRQILRLRKENVHIEFKNVANFEVLQNIGVVNHLSPETTYRLLIPSIFPKHEKILYLDSDIIVLRDVAELYTEDMGGCAVACTRAWLLPDLARYVKTILQLPIESYFNPGVMLMHIPLFSRLDIDNKGFAMLSKQNYYTQDQDVLNILCRNRVKYLDPRWNIEWGHLTGKCGDAVIDKSREGSLDAVNDPFIIHYSTFCKPWVYPELPLADYFWSEAKKTMFYEEIVYKNAIKRNEVDDIFSQYIFPWEVVQPNSRIVIYGNGAVGSAYCAQLLKTRYCHVVAVCDKYSTKKYDLAVPLISLTTLAGWSKKLYDSVVIAIKRPEPAAEIRRELIMLGLEEKQILWMSPTIK